MHGRAVGRDTEIDLAWERLARTGDAGPRGVLIEGEPGIGKSVVWGELTARLRGDARVMEARPVEAETGVSYAGLGDLLRDVEARDLGALPPPQAMALEVVALRLEPLTPLQGVRVVGTALAGLWHALAEHGPLALAVDDLQWMDEPTRRALAFALRRIPTVSLRLVLARRRTEGSGPTHSVLGVPEALATIPLGPLGADAIRRLVEERLEVRLDPTQSHRLHRLSHGNPLLAIEIGRAVGGSVDDDDAWQALADHAGITELTARRLATMPPTTRRVLAMAAALGDPRRDTIVRAMGSTTVVSRALARAQAAGIAWAAGGLIRFDHPLVAAAAYRALAPAERRELHRALAEAVDDPEARARHLALSHEEPDEDVAGRIMVGSDRATLRGAPEAAADLALAAIRLTPPDDHVTRLRRTVVAALALDRAGDGGRARALCLDMLDQVPAGPGRATLLAIVGQTHLEEDSFLEAIDALAHAAESAVGAPALEAPVHTQLAYATVNLERLHDAAASAERALAAAEAAGDGRTLAAALGAAIVTRFFVTADADRDAVERALALGAETRDLPALVRPGLSCGLVLLMKGRHRRALELLRGVTASVRDEGDETSLVPALAYESLAALHVGDVDGAAAAADESLTVSRRVGSDIALAWGLVAAGRIAGFRGDADIARSSAAGAQAHIERAGWRAAELWPASIAGSLAWWQGDGAGAIRELEAVHARQSQAGFTHEVSPAWADLLEAWIATGRRADAERLVADLAAPGPPVSRPWAYALAERGRALLAIADGRVADALAAAKRAQDHLAEGDPHPYEEGRTLLVRGIVERRAKRRADARRSLEAALDRFETLGARPWAERARTEMARLGAPVTGALTATERQVALLAARGLTNREVAASAFVTPKSVEGILSRAYAKLGIRSRAELGAWAVGHDDDGS